MSTPTKSMLSIALLFTAIFAFTASCALTSQNDQKIAEQLATLTMMVWTPTLPTTDTPIPSATATLTETPLPTETPTPTLTPTPSYDWCKGMDTRLATNQQVRVGNPLGDKSFAAYTCLLEVTRIDYLTYNEHSLVVKIGFNDLDGVLHIYTAVIGGLVGTKPQPEPFSYPACYKTNPPSLGIEEYRQSLAQYMDPAAPKAFPLLIFTEMGYRTHSPSEASLVNRNTEIHQALETAVRTKQGFPEPTEKYRLFILPGLELCQ